VGKKGKKKRAMADSSATVCTTSMMRLEDVQVMAGHSYPSTTEKYKNPNSEEQ
jgi:hypothetical protein